MRVHLILTYHPHWGQYSSTPQLIKHMDQCKFQCEVRYVPMGDQDFPIVDRRVRHYVRRQIRKNGVRVYDLNDLMAELSALGRWLQGRVDIVHYLEGEHSLQYLPSLIRKLDFIKSRPPIVATFHQPPQKLDTLINKNIVRLVDRVVALSPEQGAYLEQFLPAHQISVIPLGVNVNYFHPDTGPKEGDKFRCISVGSWLRDYDAVLKVAGILQPYPDIEFHIVSRTVAQPSHFKNVCVHTGITDEALLKAYQKSDVLFIPLADAVANNAILEGIACGLPVVSTDLPSVKAYLPGKEAILIPGNDPELAAQALLKLYHHPEIRAEMAFHARNRSIELSWSNIALKYEAMYSELIS